MSNCAKFPVPKAASHTMCWYVEKPSTTAVASYVWENEQLRLPTKRGNKRSPAAVFSASTVEKYTAAIATLSTGIKMRDCDLLAERGKYECTTAVGPLSAGIKLTF